MRSYQNLRSILVSLATISFCYAEGFSGELRMDSVIDRRISGSDLSSTNLSDRLYLSRARLRYEKDWGYGKRWSARMEFHLKELQESIFKQSVIDQSVTLDKTTLAQANVTYKMHRTKYQAGLIEVPNLTPSYEHLTLGLDSQVGSILPESGYHLGIMAIFKEGPFGGIVGAWQARSSGLQRYQSLNVFASVSETITPSSLDSAVSPETNLDSTEVLQSLPSSSFSKLSIPYGVGGRASYTLASEKNRHLGLATGMSYEIFDRPIILAVLYEPYVEGIAATSTDSAVPAEGYYRMVSFSDVFQITLDFLRTYDQTRFSSAFSMQWIPVDKTSAVLTNDTTGGAATASSSPYIFEDNGMSFGYYAEFGVLMKGYGYKVDRVKNAVTGVRLGRNDFGWEIGARVGVERTTNMVSLLNLIGINDFQSSIYSDDTGSGRYIFEGVQTDTASPYILVTVDNSGATPYVVPWEQTINTFNGFLGTSTVTQSFKTLTKGWALYANLYLTENTVCKMQFEYLWNDKRIYTRDNDYVSSINYQKDRNLQFRVESFF